MKIISKETFEEVANVKNLSAAAQFIGVTRAAVSAARKVEGFYSVKQYYIINPLLVTARAYLKTLKMQRILENPELAYIVGRYVESAWDEYGKRMV